MSTYSIADLQQLSGIKAHTIRIWEQRYKALKPKRSAGNTRYYDDDQLRRLLNMVTLMEQGQRVADVCVLSDKELEDQLDTAYSSKTEAGPLEEHFISPMLQAGLSYNEAAFEKTFAAALVRYGWTETYFRVLLPVLNRVGLLWGKATMSPAQEHFLSHLVRQKLSAAIDAITTPPVGDDTWLLFLPENEYHEVGLLFAQYYLRSHGKRVIYLGSDLPMPVLKEALKAIPATHLYTFLVHHGWNDDAKYLVQQLRKVAPKQQLLLSGNEKAISQITLPTNTATIMSLPDLEQWL